MFLIETSEISLVEQWAILKLWNTEYPAQICYQSPDQFAKYLEGLQNRRHFLLRGEQNKIQGWGLLFEREHETWFAIILSESAKNQGNGTRILNAMKSKTDQLSGWVTDHNLYKTTSSATYRSPLGFYLKNGFAICQNVRLETETLSAVKLTWSR